MNRFLKHYNQEDYYTWKKAEYSFFFILVMLFTILLIILTEMFLNEDMFTSVIVGTISILAFVLILAVIYSGKYEVGINLLIALGFSRLYLIFDYNIPFQFYFMMIVILLSIHVIYTKKYQIYLVNTFTIIFSLLQTFHIKALVDQNLLEKRAFTEAVLALYLLIAIIILLKNITTIINREIEERYTLMTQADQDPLTGICNRRKITEVFRNVIKENQLNVYLFDIDDFKRINDQYGHDFGDTVLVEISQIIKNTVPAIGFARWGGEEFILLTDNKREYGIDILNAVSKHSFKNNIKMTVSVGKTKVYPEDHIQAATKRADMAMYYGKHHGKNQLNIYEELINES